MSRAAVSAAVIGMVLLGGNAAPAHAEPFVDIYTGKSYTRDADVRIRQEGLGNDFRIRDVSFDDDSFADPPYYGGRVGYFFERYPWLGAAIDFVHFKIKAETSETKGFTGTLAGTPLDARLPVNTIVQRFDITHGVNYVTVNGLVRYSLLTDAERFPHGRIQLFAGAGLGPVVTHAENTIQNVHNHRSYEVAGLGVQGFAGVRTMLFKYVGVFAQYRFTRSELDVRVASGRGKVEEITHHVGGGLTFSLPDLW